MSRSTIMSDAYFLYSKFELSFSCLFFTSIVDCFRLWRDKKAREPPMTVPFCWSLNSRAGIRWWIFLVFTIHRGFCSRTCHAHTRHVDDGYLALKKCEEWCVVCSQEILRYDRSKAATIRRVLQIPGPSIRDYPLHTMTLHFTATIFYVKVSSKPSLL